MFFFRLSHGFVRCAQADPGEEQLPCSTRFWAQVMLSDDLMDLDDHEHPK